MGSKRLTRLHIVNTKLPGREADAAFVPIKNIENNPMQSNEGALAWMLTGENILTRRANHRHYFKIAQLKTARGPAKRLLAALQAKNSDN